MQRPRITDRNIWLVYAAIFLLGLAYGVSIALVSIFLKDRGYTTANIGSLAAWFALGIISFSLPVGALIKRFSARTTLIVSLFGYAVAVAVFPYMPSYAGIAVVRFCDGAFSVGIWVSCETILLSRCGKENKAYVTSLYAVSIACGYIAGPLLAKGIVHFLSMPIGFLTSGVIAALSGLLVVLRLDRDVAHDEGASDGEGAEPVASGAPSSSLALLWRIKTSCFATFAYGYFQASVVLFLPLFLIEHKGITKEQTIIIPAFFAAGMLIFSNVAGRIGDKIGHLRVMRVLGVIGTVMIAGFVFLSSYWLMCAAVFVAGATLAAISPVSLALQGVITERRDYARANSIYNVFYAAGMLLGPPISSRIYEQSGGGPMLYHLAALWVAFVIFSAVFFRDDPAASAARARHVAQAP